MILSWKEMPVDTWSSWKCTLNCIFSNLDYRVGEILKSCPVKNRQFSNLLTFFIPGYKYSIRKFRLKIGKLYLTSCNFPSIIIAIGRYGIPRCHLWGKLNLWWKWGLHFRINHWNIYQMWNFLIFKSIDFLSSSNFLKYS